MNQHVNSSRRLSTASWSVLIACSVILFWWLSSWFTNNEEPEFANTRIELPTPDYAGYKATFIAQQLGVSTPVAAKFLNIMRKKAVPVESLDSALKSIASSHRRTLQLVTNLKPENSQTKLLLFKVRAALEQASFDNAYRYLSQAVHVERGSSKSSIQLILAQMSLNLFQFSRAAMEYQKAIDFAKREKNPAKVAEYQMYLALVNLNRREAGDSLALLKNSFALCQKQACSSELVTSILSSTGKAWLAKGAEIKAIKWFKDALAYKDFASVGNRSLVAGIWTDIGESYMRVEQRKKALIYFQKALNVQLSDKGNSSKLLDLWVAKADALAALGMQDEAFLLYTKALTQELKALKRKHPRAARLWLKLGDLSVDRGEINKALQHYIKARDIRFSLFGPRHKSVAEVWERMARVWSLKQAHEYSIKYYFKALDVYRAEHDKQYVKIAELEDSLGIVWMQMKDYKKAIRYFEYSLDNYRRNYDESHPGVISVTVRLGDAWSGLKQYKKAVFWHSVAFNSYQKILPADDFRLAKLRHSIANASMINKNYVVAAEHFTDALPAYRRKFGVDDKRVAQILENLGNAWAQQGNLNKAVIYLQQSFDLRAKNLGRQHPVTVVTEKNLRSVQVRLK